MQNLGLLEAISKWFDGQKLDGMTLWGWPVLYWGRLGKALSFIGGVVAVLDIIGADRLREWGRKFKGKRLVTPRILLPALIFAIFMTLIMNGVFNLGKPLPKYTVVHPGAAPLNEESALVMLVFLAILGLSVASAYLVSKPAARLLVWLLDHERPAQVLRWSAYVFFIVGFFFDFLAS